MKRAIFLICFTVLTGSTCAQIIGGEDADIKDFPYTASLRISGEHHCGACIISDKHVLTAAHCIDEQFVAPYNDASVHTGMSTSQNNVGEPHPIATITIHPQWINTQETSLNHDIAVVTLKQKIRFNPRQKSIKLASTDVISGTNAIVTGWGWTTPAENSEKSENLQKLRMTLLNNKDCQNDHSIGKLYDEQLCAYFVKGYGTCFGDSGGPLVNDVNELVGILSWIVEDDCATGIPEVYVNVYAYKSFIMSVMNK